MRSHCALYVDAGYLLASAATRVTGTSLRNAVVVDNGTLIDGLIAQAEAHSDLPLLRVNWYDAGNRHGAVDAAHDAIGVLPRVKLRLGRVSWSGEQKGVDVRLGLDLATHGRNRVCDVMFLVSGDDDLTEAVEEAQGHGIQVVLLVVPDADGRPHAVSRHLRREADGMVLIDADLIDRAVRKPIPAPAALSGDEGTEAPAVGEEAMAAGAPEGPEGNEGEDRELADDGSGSPTPSLLAKRPAVRPVPAAKRPTSELAWSTRTGDQAPVTGASAHGGNGHSGNGHSGTGHGGTGHGGLPADELAAIDDVCRSVIGAWLRGATPEHQGRLTRGRPHIPGDIDRALLMDLSAKLGIYELDDVSRYVLRERFWDIADELVG